MLSPINIIVLLFVLFSSTFEQYNNETLHILGGSYFEKNGSKSYLLKIEPNEFTMSKYVVIVINSTSIKNQYAILSEN